MKIVKGRKTRPQIKHYTTNYCHNCKRNVWVIVFDPGPARCGSCNSSHVDTGIPVTDKGG